MRWPCVLDDSVGHEDNVQYVPMSVGCLCWPRVLAMRIMYTVLAMCVGHVCWPWVLVDSVGYVCWP